MNNNTLIFVKNYLPGYKSGGPVRSVANIVSEVDLTNFTVVSSDRDAGDYVPYKDVNNKGFNQVDLNKKLHNVLYLPIGLINRLKKLRLIFNQTFGTLYLNSFFDFNYTLFPLVLAKIGLIKVSKIVIAPRGELMDGALSIKKFKKLVYLTLAKKLLITDDVIFHSTSDEETIGIKVLFTQNMVITVSNLPSTNDSFKRSITTKRNVLKLIYISRITEKKNLLFLLKSFKKIERSDIEIVLDVFGPVADKDIKYFHACYNFSKTLKNVNFNYNGTIEHSNVTEKIKEYDYFVLPTLGENFGHAIAESLLAGTPVILSKFTPFSDAEDYNSGFIIDIENELDLNRRIDDLLLFKNNFTKFQEIRDYAISKLNIQSNIDKYQQLFR